MGISIINKISVSWLENVCCMWKVAHNIHVVVSHESKELSVKHVAALCVKQQHMWMGVFFGQLGNELLSPVQKHLRVDPSIV